jgi:paraquat-inducible protein B
VSRIDPSPTSAPAGPATAASPAAAAGAPQTTSAGNGQSSVGEAASNAGHRLPRPHVRTSRWPFPIVWIVPLAALVAAGFYFRRILQERGPVINITFDDASGIKTGETPVTVKGVRIGTVDTVSLSPDERHAIVHIRLQTGASDVAKKDSIFWLVKPDITGGNIIGVGAIASGPYIEVLPGHGDATTDFVGVTKAPAMVGEGIRVILHADKLGKLEVDSPVYYRGIQVGAIQDVRLSDDSSQVNATAFIWLRYSRLLYSNSQFWTQNDTSVKGSIFSGLQVQLGSLRSLLGGGVEFATPEQNRGDLAEDGSQFSLHDDSKKEWLAWAPKIELGGDTMKDTGVGTTQQQNQSGLQSSVRVK